MAGGHCGVETVFSGHLVAPEPRLSQQLPPGSQVTGARSTLTAGLPHSSPRLCPRLPGMPSPVSIGPLEADPSFLAWLCQPCFPQRHSRLSPSILSLQACCLALVLVLVLVKPQPRLRASQPLLVCKAPERFQYILSSGLSLSPIIIIINNKSHQPWPGAALSTV